MLEERMRVEGEQAGRMEPRGQSLQATLKRGWYFGGESFRERLLELARSTLKGRMGSKDHRASPEMRDHAESWAGELVKKGLEVCGIRKRELERLPKGDERKVLIALAVKRGTTVPLGWIAGELKMGARSTVSREVAAMARRLPMEEEWARLYQRIVGTDVP